MGDCYPCDSPNELSASTTDNTPVKVRGFGVSFEEFWMFALIDCNNFFASCERLFRPDLRNKPVIVLSSNDGCVVARSNEAKALGIAMGVPYFKIKALCIEEEVEVFSSNFTLYNHLSQRIMRIIEDTWPHVEIYSIDEAFIDLSRLDASYHDLFCKELQQKIGRYTGIPTSIGIGPTKTLAKLANHIAKKELKIPVFNISEQREWLKAISIADVWGIGRQWHKQLMRHQIHTAYDLATANPAYLRQQFNVVMQRTNLELNGISCAGFNEQSPQQSITSSRSFGSEQRDEAHLAQAISSHCAIASEKLRRNGLLAKHLHVFMCSNRFKHEAYYHAIDFKLLNPTDDLRYITTCAKFCLKKIYQPSVAYKKAGIILSDLSTHTPLQMDLFDNKPTDLRSKQFMQIMDKINTRFGRQTIRLAAEGHKKPWNARAELRSPNYTTEWSELPLVRLY